MEECKQVSSESPSGDGGADRIAEEKCLGFGGGREAILPCGVNVLEEEAGGWGRHNGVG